MNGGQGQGWPDVESLLEGLQRPNSSLTDDGLRNADLRRLGDGTPWTAMGQNAVVFELRAGSRRLAVRVFTRCPPEGSDRRYEQIEALRRQTGIRPLVASRWLGSGLLIDGQHYPVVEMDMIDGVPLGRWVAAHAASPDRISGAAESFRELAKELRVNRFAHGDLQGGNLLVTSGGGLRLIDYDGVWLPGVADAGVAERGHVHFQHPQRVSDGGWHEHVDAFSALSVYLSLSALACSPSLVEFCGDDHLLFKDVDYRNPNRTEVWNVLASSRDVGVRRLAGTLALLCERQEGVATCLEELIGSDSVTGFAPLYTPAFDAVWSPADAEEVADAHEGRPRPPEAEPAPLPQQAAAATGTKPVLVVLAAVVLIALSLALWVQWVL